MPMDRLLAIVLRKLVTKGNLLVTTAGGSAFVLGDGSGIPCAIRFTTYAAQYGALLDPELKFGEAYVDGGLVVEQGSISDVLSVLVTTPRRAKWLSWGALLGCIRFMLRRLHQFNWRGRSRRNVAHHYDLDDRLYEI